ncbi:MAG: metalloregulator ArsR/SmtB family transcription factor [Acidobacteria bacterium]|nr:metalloregulator ArsR/SmtB family transcription factor [Acidobacteriota bacterium]
MGDMMQARQQSRELNKFFKALSDETRRNILQILERGEHSVGEIVSNFGLAQPTISRHLSVLKEANLVLDERRGQQVIYSLNPQAMAFSAKRFFGEFSHFDGKLG